MSCSSDSTVILDEWVRFAITRGAEVLDIQLSSRNGVLDTENVYVFPHWLLSELNASTLRHLSLQRCILKPPTDFDIFIWLTTLCLNKVIVDPAFLAHLFSVCSLLESLTLSYCRGGSCLIVGPSLRLNDLKVLRCVGLKRVEIDAEDIPQTVLTLRNLKQVNLDLFMGNFNLGSVLNILKAAPRTSFRRVYNNGLLISVFLRPLFCAYLNKMTVRATSYQGDVRNLSGFSHDHLRRFKMQGFQGKWIEIELAVSILKIATNLEVLVIDPYGKYYNGGGSWIEISRCYYREGYENEGKDDNEEKIFLHIEDSVDVVDLQYFWWKQRGSVVVRKRLKEVMTDAQILVVVYGICPMDVSHDVVDPIGVCDVSTVSLPAVKDG
ncbi:uncharacterized protein LOC133733705 [Rosa rugosa]|uniref:uncharacterized protein LOC133733705 n=1 Tax=Rosa rugosa TaxID=74645 RepID=UPI002B417F21|nr:uncharacterized protein LOC133733705 [Rosa rugosa]